MRGRMKKEKDEDSNAVIPIWHKVNLTLSEAAKYSNIGERSIVELIESGSTHFSFRVGNKRLINRELFEEFIKEGCRIGFN